MALVVDILRNPEYKFSVGKDRQNYINHSLEVIHTILFSFKGGIHLNTYTTVKLPHTKAANIFHVHSIALAIFGNHGIFPSCIFLKQSMCACLCFDVRSMI